MIPERLIGEFEGVGSRRGDRRIEAKKQRSVTYRILNAILLIFKILAFGVYCRGLRGTRANCTKSEISALRTHFSASKIDPYCDAVERIRLLAGSIRKVNETK